MHTNTAIDFGYPWALEYGHLVIALPALALLAAGIVRKWALWSTLLLGAVSFWSVSAFLVAWCVIGINSEGSLPTESFFTSGEGRVLDIGAGTGRSSIMLLKARPKAELVALDLFGESFDTHFGHAETPQERLLANLQAAGVGERARIETADMRQLPFEPASFDAIISAYAVDHLGSKGIDQALAEAGRVIKPGGDFLLMIVGKEPWVQYAFGPLLLHGGPRGTDWWTEHLQTAGFHVREHGTKPATLYLLARR